MKNIFISSLLFISGLAYSQVIIGDEVGSASDKTSVLLDFATNQNRGILLPATRNLPAGSGLVEGTIVLDASDPLKAKVKYYNGSWQDLSNGNEADITSYMTIQPLETEETTQGIIIGSETSTADGVLILESTDKAMVLPMAESTDEIIDPAPGMMVYINKEGAKRLAVFNGSGWTFWMP